MHLPVMLREVIGLLDVRAGGRYIDGTLGGGGHAEAILHHAGEAGRLLGLDRDMAAVERCRERLAPFAGRFVLQHGNFASMTAWAQRHGFEGADGVLLDLGFSSFQVDEAERGFSFRQEGPLDMRMDRSEPQSAADLVNGLPAEELADLLWRLGEESASRRIARVIVEERAKAPIETTGRLAEIVARAKGGVRGRIHPATQTFQALRMAVNRELESIDEGLGGALQVLKPGGRLAVITFHSLEDRAVKRFFAAHAGRMVSLEAGGARWEGELPRVERVNRKPVVAAEDEVRGNARARSAKLRVVEKVREK